MYKFKTYNNNGLSIVSEKWLVTVSRVKGYIYVSINGPNRYRKRGLSNVTQDLSAFELKATALHFYRLAREHANHKAYGDYKEPNWLIDTNYADIFGSLFD
jgi:hypothetical protein